jgi:hypothetical protein
MPRLVCAQWLITEARVHCRSNLLIERENKRALSYLVRISSLQVALQPQTLFAYLIHNTQFLFFQYVHKVDT